MAETKRAIRQADALDTAGDHLAQMLRRTDELLAEWSKFGIAVRTQVEREAGNIGHAVGSAVEDAVRRATATGVERAFADQIGAKLAALSAEIAKVETRARAASRAITDERRGDRTILYALGGALLIANGLLVAVLLRSPPAPVAAAPAPLVLPAPAPQAAPAPIAEPPATEPPKSSDPKSDASSDAKSATSEGKSDARSDEKPAPKPAAKSDAKSGRKPAAKPEAKATKSQASEAKPTHKGVKHGAPAGRGTKGIVPPARKL